MFETSFYIDMEPCKCYIFNRSSRKT